MRCCSWYFGFVGIRVYDFARSPFKRESMHYSLNMLSLSFRIILNSLRCYFGQKIGIFWIAQTIMNESRQDWQDDWYRSRSFIQAIICCSAIPRAWAINQNKWQMRSKTSKCAPFMRIMFTVINHFHFFIEYTFCDLDWNRILGEKVQICRRGKNRENFSKTNRTRFQINIAP